MLLRSFDRPLTQGHRCPTRIVVAVGLAFIGLMPGTLDRASAEELGETTALISTAIPAAGPLQVDAAEEGAVVDETAPADTQSETVTESVPAPAEAAPQSDQPEAEPEAASVEATPVLPPSGPSSSPAAAPPTVPNPSVTRPSHGVGKYTVAKGDTMFSIAKKAELSLGLLSAVNNISDPAAVKAGQTLYIPAQPGSVHVAARGDTVQSIAEKYKLKPDAIREANRLEKDGKLDSGQLVLIPGVIPSSATAIKPSTATPQTVSAAANISSLASPKSAQAVLPAARAPRAAAGDTLVWPVVGPLSTNYSPSHRGLDVVANQGIPIKAALAGRVIGAAEADGPYGWYVMLEHGGGFTTVYAHLSKIRVKVGDVLQKGQILGEVGSTGQSTGAHLHFELRQSNVPIDPRPYLP